MYPYNYKTYQHNTVKADTDKSIIESISINCHLYQLYLSCILTDIILIYHTIPEIFFNNLKIKACTILINIHLICYIHYKDHSGIKFTNLLKNKHIK